MIQTCLAASYGFILILWGPRPHAVCENIFSMNGQSCTSLPSRLTTITEWCQRRSQPRMATFSQVALRPSVLPVAVRGGCRAKYGVHGLEPCGEGSSPRFAVQ